MEAQLLSLQLSLELPEMRAPWVLPEDVACSYFFSLPCWAGDTVAVHYSIGSGIEIPDRD